MSETPSPRRPRPAAGLAGLIVLGLAPGALANDVTAYSKVRFPQDAELPLKIAIGMVVIDFTRINGREEWFELQGYLHAKWRVPSLALKPDEPRRGVRRLYADELWSPNLDFVNSLEQVQTQNEKSFLVSDDGEVQMRVRVTGKFAAPLDLRRFPLDEQELRVIVEPFERAVDEVVFTADEGHIGRYETAFLTDWTLREVRGEATSNHHTLLEQTRSRFVLTIRVRRRSTFYLWRVLVPLTLLVAVSWGVFWVDPTQLQPQISTAVAVLLNVVVFNFTIDFALPKVAYLTFIDLHAMTAYLLMLAEILAVFLIHDTYNRRGLDAARAIQHGARWSFPAAFALAMLVEWLSIFGAS